MSKVLIIDDDPNIVALYRTEFEILGHDVVTASEGQRGFDLAVSEKPNLILLDVILPKVSGISILDELKTNETTKHIPVVVVSNFGQKENPKSAKEHGAEKFLFKYAYTPSQVAQESIVVLSGQKSDT